MPNRLEQILESEERRNKKKEQLFALLRDPDLTDLVAKLVEEAPRAVPQPRAVLSNGNGHKSKLPSSATAAIREIAPILPDPFTIHDVIKVLDDAGYVYPRPKKADVVRDAIYFMLRRGNAPFRVVTRGEAGELSTYQYVPQD